MLRKHFNFRKGQVKQTEKKTEAGDEKPKEKEKQQKKDINLMVASEWKWKDFRL